MEQKQKLEEPVAMEQAQAERAAQRTERRRRLRIETLETRVAPNAVWTD